MMMRTKRPGSGSGSCSGLGPGPDSRRTLGLGLDSAPRSDFGVAQILGSHFSFYLYAYMSDKEPNYWV